MCWSLCSPELPSNLEYKSHLKRQWNCKLLRCGWSEHRLSVLLRLRRHFRLNIWRQWIGHAQLQERETSSLSLYWRDYVIQKWHFALDLSYRTWHFYFCFDFIVVDLVGLFLLWFYFVLGLPIKLKEYCACMHVGQGWKLKQNMSIILCTITRGVILFSLRLQSHMLMSNISPTSALCDGKSETKDFIKPMNRLQECTTPWCGRSIPATNGAWNDPRRDSSHKAQLNLRNKQVTLFWWVDCDVTGPLLPHQTLSHS